MIYVSSSCVKNKRIKDSVLELYNAGFNNIELSGGTEYYEGIIDDLLESKEKYDLNLMCHNYFPPPKEHFVLNLASLDDKTYNDSIEHLIGSIKLSEKIGAKKFAFHAGFFLDVKVSEIGKKITSEVYKDKDKAIKRFIDAYNILIKESNSIKLYIENNVLSQDNFNNYNDNIFMLTNKDEYIELKKEIDFNLLLDTAHLKVSSNSLNNDFYSELNYLVKETDYIHISDNDGTADTNGAIYDEKVTSNLKNKTVTMETYIDKKEIINNYNYINRFN